MWLSPHYKMYSLELAALVTFVALISIVGVAQLDVVLGDFITDCIETCELIHVLSEKCVIDVFRIGRWAKRPQRWPSVSSVTFTLQPNLVITTKKVAKVTKLLVSVLALSIDEQPVVTSTGDEALRGRSAQELDVEVLTPLFLPIRVQRSEKYIITT